MNLQHKDSETLQENNAPLKKFVAYYRVSTKKQGFSGLGLEAQKIGVERFLQSCNGELQSEYTDVLSGSLNASKRTGFFEAINECVSTGATLVVFKLDRLGRNLLNFVQDVLENKKLSFAIAEKNKCFDAYTNGNDLMLLKLEMVLAEGELERIRERTRQATEAKKAKGANIAPSYVLTIQDKEKGAQIRKENAYHNENNKNAYAFASALYKSGVRSFSAIANELNSAKMKSARGLVDRWEKKAVKRLFELYAKTELRFDAFIQEKPTTKKELIQYIKKMIETDCKPLNEVAKNLNSLGVPTAKGGKWFAQTVKRYYNKNAVL